ncbi:MAG: hypothetical protein H6742_13720 [Alphaproteobacteria bacterium]|nr:hypothetical protein [Alphaproteobacteria bacterium]
MRPRDRAFIVAAWAAVVGLFALSVAPSWQHWHVADDLTNMRWVLDHRDAPWRALTGRHSVHEHVRPLTLIATWAGAMLGDGRFHGVWAANVGLLLAGIVGAGALAARLAGDRRAGPVAALVLLSTGGAWDLPWWNAWICSAGELAAATWALFAWVGAMRSGRLPVVGLLLLVAAGLFKEPGWLVAGPMVLLALQHRRILPAVGAAAVAVGGIAFTWHPANVLRSGNVSGGRLERLDGFLTEAVEASGDLGAPRLLLFGLLLLLLCFSLAPTVRARLSLLLPIAVAVVGWLLGLDPVGFGLAAAFALALVLARGAPAAPGLWLMLAVWGPLCLYPGTNTVQRLTGAAGLAVALAVGLTGWPSWPRRVAAAAVGLVAAASVLRPPRAPAIVGDTETSVARGQLFLGIGAIGRAVGAPTLHRTPAADWGRDDLVTGELVRLAPMVGMRPREDLPRGALQVEQALIPGDPSVFLQADRLDGLELPVTRTDTGRRLRPRPGGRAPVDETEAVPLLELDVGAGWYALGVVQRGEADAAVEARDACGHKWAPTAPTEGVSATIVPLELTADCLPLGVLRTRHGDEAAGRPFLTALYPPALSLRRAPLEGPLLDVSIQDEALDLPTRGGGPRPPQR